MARYTRVTVFKNAQHDGTNGGVSSRHVELYILDPEEGQELRHEPDPRLVFRAEDRGGGYMALLPVTTLDDKIGPMFGGNLASSLYGHGGEKVYRIHDRFETPEEYRVLSS